MFQFIAILLGVAISLIDGGVPCDRWTDMPPVGTLTVPEDYTVRRHAAASGVQSYQCKTPGVTATFLDVNATLYDCTSGVVGVHDGFTHPNWEFADGLVAGMTEASYAHDASSVPWLLLNVTARHGIFLTNGVDYILRVNTIGDIPPVCNSSDLGYSIHVPYTATTQSAAYALLHSKTRSPFSVDTVCAARV